MARIGRPPTVDWYARTVERVNRSLDVVFRESEARILNRLWVEDAEHGQHLDKEGIERRRRVARNGPALDRFDHATGTVTCEQHKSWKEQVL